MKLIDLFLAQTPEYDFWKIVANEKKKMSYKDQNSYRQLQQDCIDVKRKIRRGHTEPIHSDPKMAQNPQYMEGYKKALSDVIEYINIRKWKD